MDGCTSVDRVAEAVPGRRIDDNEVFQALYYDSMMNGQNPQDVIEQYRKNNLLPAVKMAMIEDRVITHLLDKHNGLKK